MSGLYQIPGLFITALCHVIVICYLSEHKYSKKKYTLYSCIYIAGFVGIGGYGYVTWGATLLFAYIVIVVCTFLFSCIVSQSCFAKKCFLFITYFCLFSAMDNVLKIVIKLLFPKVSAPVGFYVAVILRSMSLLAVLALYKKFAETILRSLADKKDRR